MYLCNCGRVEQKRYTQDTPLAAGADLERKWWLIHGTTHEKLTVIVPLVSMIFLFYG
jgi:hypothetical protein